MIRKFVGGLIFGSGFAISFLLIAYLGLEVSARKIRAGPDRSMVPAEVQPELPTPPEESGPQFHELPLEEQIRKASVIALARYEPAPDGKQRAIITEFLKKEKGTTIYYSIGDEFPDSSFYPRDKSQRGDGAIVFFVGSPASMRMSLGYSGDRIRGLGDIPLKLLREKCEADEL